MRQLIQDLTTGKSLIEDVPPPKARTGYMLIETTPSLVSLGTECILVEFGKANLIDKAWQQPDILSALIVTLIPPPPGRTP